MDGCQESFRQRGKLSLHRRTHETFVKKEYRLLNNSLVKPTTDDDETTNFEKPLILKRTNEQRVEHLSTTTKEECEKSHDSTKVKIKALTQNWVPLKRRKLGTENELGS